MLGWALQMLYCFGNVLAELFAGPFVLMMMMTVDDDECVCIDRWRRIV